MKKIFACLLILALLTLAICSCTDNNEPVDTTADTVEDTIADTTPKETDPEPEETFDLGPVSSDVEDGDVTPNY